MKGKRLRRIHYLFIFCFAVHSLYAQSDFQRAKSMLSLNHPDQAVPLLYKVIEEEAQNAQAYLYLGLAYNQLGKYGDARVWLMKGKPLAGTDAYLFDFNLGNTYFMLEQFEAAEHAYGQAIHANGYYAPAFLNRANVYMKQEKFAAAVQDYKMYLQLNPATGQKAAIQQIIGLLEERDRAEKARLAVEKQNKEIADQKYQQLQDEVNSSLDNLDKADAVSAESEDTINFSQEYTLE